MREGVIVLLPLPILTIVNQHVIILNMKDQFTAVYEHNDNDPELAEAADAAIKYIMLGDTLDAIFDIRGLPFFAIVSALREHDGDLYGDDDKKLDDEQKARRHEVEAELQKAEDSGMHYYPFGDAQDRTRLDERDYGSIAGKRTGSVVNATTWKGSAQSLKSRANRRKEFEENVRDLDTKSGPVTARRNENITEE